MINRISDEFYSLFMTGAMVTGSLDFVIGDNEAEDENSSYNTV